MSGLQDTARRVAAGEVTITAIIETTVADVAAYHAACLNCPDWRCHQQPHHTPEVALRCAERHQERRHADAVRVRMRTR